MRILLSREPARHVLRWTQRVLFVCAALALGYCGFALVDSWIFQHRERRHFEQFLHDQEAVDVAAPSTADPVSLNTSAQDTTGGLIGRLEIPRLGLSAILIEGTSGSALRRALGHIAGTALPGRPGNIGIAGHRDTFFRPLR